MGAVAMALGWSLTRSEGEILAGAQTWFLYRIGMHRLIPRDHRHGIRLVKQRRFEEAIMAFENSYAFFNRHRWIDRWRCLTLQSASTVSYREMALVNIAFCASQIGQGTKSKEYDRRALLEFPESGIAPAALKLIESAEQAVKPVGVASQTEE